MEKESGLIFENARRIYTRISHAAMRAGRSAEEIELLAVTKTVPAERIMDAVDAGLRRFGENRVQEARDKIPHVKALLPDARIEWHLIGHLQKNKARYAVQLFDLIHSVDSEELAEEVNKQSERIGKIQEVLIEVKLSPEETKHGVPESDFRDLLERVTGLSHLRLRGLMTVPPFSEDPEEARPYFRELRALKEMACAEGFDLPVLSMGMSHDFEVAIEEGATIVRVGTALFGER